jgi:chemotaxis protein MotB
MADDSQRPIIIKKIKKVSGGGHHGGAWKVAYADFVTAMMAFFLLLWLLGSTSEEQKQGIANYFDPISVSRSTMSGSGGMLGGQTAQSESGVMSEVTSSFRIDKVTGLRPNSEGDTAPGVKGTGDVDEKSEDDKKAQATDVKQAEITDTALEKAMEKLEDERFQQAEAELREALEGSPELQGLADNLLIDQTPEGMRIQIIDQSKKEMFSIGSSRMYPHTVKLLKQVALVIKKLPNKIELNGHTDAKPYKNFKSYSNWELSTNRANASRRVLIEEGLDAKRIESVTGRADRDPLIPEDPEAPMNRRISIIMLKDSVLRDKHKSKSPLVKQEKPTVKKDVTAVINTEKDTKANVKHPKDKEPEPVEFIDSLL